MVTTEESPCRGRRRDASIDERVLVVASRHLAERGFAGFSLSAIAEEACTTRQALYRRWPTKESLIADAIRLGPREGTAKHSAEPRQDLDQELERWMSRSGAGAGMALAGVMLQDHTPTDARDCYREHVFEPRQRRLRQILVRAQERQLIDADADLDAAVGMAIGSVYASHLAGRFESDWAGRTAALVWRSVGGSEGRT
jgi:AcrR family transcriptional regulator